MKREKQGKVISDELIDEMLQGRTAEDVNVLLNQFTEAVLERALRRDDPASGLRQARPRRGKQRQSELLRQ